MMGNYLIFGGSGFVGYHLAKHIKEKESIEGHIFDIVNPRIKSEFFKKIDVRREVNPLYKAPRNDVIFNLAEIHTARGHASNEYFETNIIGGENVCSYARLNGIRTIVFTSSISVYGVSEKQKTEITLPMLDIPYGISKLMAEYIHRQWQKEDCENRGLIILRLGVVFGQFVGGNFTRLINAISKRMFCYSGRRDTIKSCIYVRDLVMVMVEMLDKGNAGENIYNMTYYAAPTIEVICEVISKRGNLKSPNIKTSSIILIGICKMAYHFFNLRGVHPDRVKKLMVSKDINGVKVKQIMVWMRDYLIGSMIRNLKTKYISHFVNNIELKEVLFIIKVEFRVLFLQKLNLL